MKRNKLAKETKKEKGITLIALVITIIVLLILAGVSIAMLTGPNGLITQATSAKVQTEQAGAKEKVEVAVASSYGVNGFDKEKFKEEIKNLGGEVKLEDDPLVAKMGSYEVALDGETGEIESLQDTTKASQLKAPDKFATTTLSDLEEWYSYGEAKVNTPKLKGGMTPIKFEDEITDAEGATKNKWANAITADGSMWVWIPRYAYKITEKGHTAEAGQINIAFIDESNNFLNNSDQGTITEDPTLGGAGSDTWLVHPAFTTNADNGGGFGELAGIWVGKFEATGSKETLSVKPGTASLRTITINESYKLAKSSTFGENLTAEELGSHMAKNSEWGAVAYLAHSKYGTNANKVEKNSNSQYYTGGDNNIEKIYKNNIKQSTTHNATGVYDMNGGAWERVASYVDNSNGNLTTYGGNQSGDLYGTEEEHNKSTKYKTVYQKGDNDTEEANYTQNQNMKGDAVWETSSGINSDTHSWFSTFAHFPSAGSPFFARGGGWNHEPAGSFAFSRTNGGANTSNSFRPVLAF